MAKTRTNAIDVADAADRLLRLAEEFDQKVEELRASPPTICSRMLLDCSRAAGLTVVPLVHSEKLSLHGIPAKFYDEAEGISVRQPPERRKEPGDDLWWLAFLGWMGKVRALPGIPANDFAYRVYGDWHPGAVYDDDDNAKVLDYDPQQCKLHGPSVCRDSATALRAIRKRILEESEEALEVVGIPEEPHEVVGEDVTTLMCAVALDEETGTVTVRGIPKHLSDAQLKVVSVLVSHFPKRVSLQTLVTESGKKDAPNIITRLQKDADWKAAIIRDGKSGRGYGLDHFDQNWITTISPN